MMSQNRRQRDQPPASLEAQRHRAYSAKATMAEELKCGVNSVHMSTCGQNSRHGFLKECIENEEGVIETPLLSPGIAPRNRFGIFHSGTLELKIPKHSLLAFVALAKEARFLRVFVPPAKRVVNHLLNDG